MSLRFGTCPWTRWGELARVDEQVVVFDSVHPTAPLARVGSDRLVGEGPSTAVAGGSGASWATPDWRGLPATATDPFGASTSSDSAKAGFGLEMPKRGGTWSTTAERPQGSRIPGQRSSEPPEFSFGNGLSLAAGGELGIDGLTWLRYRTYDPSSRSFLSTDPLAPVPGSGSVGNPYAYAANNPVGLSDPWGLTPVSDQQIQEQSKNDNDGGGLWGKVKRGVSKAVDVAKGAGSAVVDAGKATASWAKRNKDWLINGAMVAGGGLLIATGAGATVGTGLVMAGADGLIQKATTGKVNYVQVAESGLLGAAAGGASSWALKASEYGPKALLTTVGVNAGIGAVSGDVGYVASNQIFNTKTTARGLVANFLGGGVAGAAGGAAGAAGGTIAKAVGRTASSGLASAATASINFFGGAVGSAVTDLTNGNSVNPLAAAFSGVGGAVGGQAVSRLVSRGVLADAAGTSTLRQLSRMGVRSLQGLVNWSRPGTKALYQQGIAGGIIDAGLAPVVTAGSSFYPTGD